MNFKNVTIIGSGVLGSQIAFQSAFFGCHVTIYGKAETSIEKTKVRLRNLQQVYGDYFNDHARAAKTFEDFTYETDLAQAVADADVVIESVPEKIEIKQELYTQLAAVAPEKTVFLTNSSTLLPSQFAEFTGRPDKFLALHFANSIWEKNTAEVMGHAGTNPEYIEQVTEFARNINMIPFVLKKEQPGYILNSLLVPFLASALELWVKDVADPQTIDKNWMLSTGSPRGPFAILDIVGMETPYNLHLMLAQQNPAAQFVADKIKHEMIDQGKMGIATGQGFYSYPNPAYKDPNFLTSN